MKDRSKKLTVINTGRKSVDSGKPTNMVECTGHDIGAPVNMSDYLLKRIWDKIFEIRSTDDGEEYIFCKTNLVSQFGITTYVDGGMLDLPSIYDGLQIDNQTLIWEDINGVRVLKARVGSSEGGEIMPSYLGDLQNVGSWANGVASEDRLMVQRKGYSNWESISLSLLTDSVSFANVKEDGGGNAYTSFSLSSDKKTLTFNKGKVFAEKSNSLKGYGITDAYTKIEADELLAKKWTADNVKIQNWDTAFGWGDHSKAGYALKTYVDETFIGIKGDYTVEGTKNFVGSLQVNGCPIVYDAQKKYWKLEGDLLITGGIASFSSDMAYDPISIMDGILTDDVTIRVNETTKKLEVIGGGGSDGAKVKIVSVGDSMDEPNTLYVVV